jgi:DNA-binding protein H-NS
MPTYAEYMQQIAELQTLAEQARRKEVEEARTKIRELMQAHGLAADDLKENAKSVSKVREPIVPKYKDPVSGKTWTGRGRAPSWLNGRDKKEFIIN